MTLILIVCCILFIGSCTRSAIGFGDSLIAMSLLPFFISVKTATPLVAICASLIGGMILWSKWNDVEFVAVWRLIVSSIVGIPLGLYALGSLPESWVKVGLGVLLVLFSGFNLLKPNMISIQSERWAFLAGFLAGILGSAYNTNGPPVVMYASMRAWSPERFVATIQGYFFPTGLFIVLGHALSGLWTPEVFGFLLWGAPCVVAAVILGGFLREKIQPGSFDKFIHVFLMFAGFGMLYLR